ncbi:hypothetical protein ACE1TI_12765 [Alteribacillus sp. JSM 102045]|uniref:hypothetical protein n=1 Tax=Alteribacillus sp. JSM 102045 TaxID=1562101 RepID=UPI0035C030EB
MKLTTGEGGVVVSQHKGLPQRPVVQVFKAFFGQNVDYDITDLDPVKHTTLFIQNTVE